MTYEEYTKMSYTFAVTAFESLRKKEGFVPIIGLFTLFLTWGRYFPALVYLVLFLVLVSSVLASVHHAEVLAAKVGEPFGSIVLALAVTVIEVGIIIMIMSGGGAGTETLLRDTIFSVVMLTTNIIVGISLFVSTKKGKLGYFNAEGAGTALAGVMTLSVFILVLPRFTITSPGPVFSQSQFVFTAVASLIIYVSFIGTQTKRHRDFFLPIDEQGNVLRVRSGHVPSVSVAITSLVILLVSIIAVVGIAKVTSPFLESSLIKLGLPNSLVGVLIALMILSPETIAAYHAAKRGKIMVGLNLAYGSSLASIGLTVPTMLVANFWLNTQFELGLNSTQLVLLCISAFVSALTIIPGRATRQESLLHLALAAAYVFLAVVP